MSVDPSTTHASGPRPGSKTLLVIVAHPDDETFGCGSLLLHAAAQDARTVVVCATRGEAGEVVSGVDVPDGDLGALREAELREAAGLAGVDEVEVLGLLDSGMDGDPAPGTLCATPLADLAETVRDIVARHSPDVVITLAGSDGHRDHIHLGTAVSQALAGSAIALYEACLPRTLLHEWLVARSGDDSAEAYRNLPDIGTPDHGVTTVLDTSAHYAARLDAIARHRSQSSPFDGLPEPLRRRFLAEDHLVRVNPPWTGGSPEVEILGLA